LGKSLKDLAAVGVERAIAAISMALLAGDRHLHPEKTLKPGTPAGTNGEVGHKESV
jgi:hypothetical protein